jgi:hypothetical protein
MLLKLNAGREAVEDEAEVVATAEVAESKVVVTCFLAVDCMLEKKFDAGFAALDGTLGLAGAKGAFVVADDFEPAVGAGRFAVRDAAVVVVDFDAGTEFTARRFADGACKDSDPRVRLIPDTLSALFGSAFVLVSTALAGAFKGS